MTTAGDFRLSILMSSHNYAEYVEQAIRSVLDQSVRDIEVIMVDDGSTDGSVAIIESIRDERLRLIQQPNAGQAAAMNRAFAEARAPIVIFCDSDDFLLPGALALHLSNFESDPAIVRSQAYMQLMVDGTLTGERLPGRVPPDGDLLQMVLDYGPGAVVSTPNSGNAWSRAFLQRVFPLPLASRGIGPDALMMDAAPLFGRIVTTDADVAVYRIHGRSKSDLKRGLSERSMSLAIDHYAVRSEWLAALARASGRAVDQDRWLGKNWRVLTLMDLRARLMQMPSERPPAAKYLGSARAVNGGLHKRLAIAALIAFLRILPVSLALRLARNVIHPEHM